MNDLIIIDIDSILHDLSITEAFVAFKEFGLKVEWVEPPEWSLGLYPVEDRDLKWDIWKRCHDREYIFLTKPLRGSVTAVNTLVDAGYRVAYFTDRKREAYDDTYEWLRDHGFPNPERLKCCRDKKEEILKLKDEVVTIIDDRPRTLVWGVYELGLDSVFGLKYAWNRNLTDIPGVHLRNDWDDLMKVFNEEIND